MAFIKIRRLQTNDRGQVICGSASLVDTEYVRGEKHHSRQIVRERLGKILWLAEDHRSGIFCSPERGIFGYDAREDVYLEVPEADARISHVCAADMPKGTRELEFGNTYAFLEFLRERSLLRVMRDACRSYDASDPCDGETVYRKLLLYICYTVLKNAENITCEQFVRDSCLSFLIPETLDAPFFCALADPDFQSSFFRSLAGWCREKYPDFGKCRCVDTIPLPDDMENGLLHAAGSHGASEYGGRSRLVLLLDEATGLPVWYAIVQETAANCRTLSSIRNAVGDLLHLQISSFVLGDEYISREDPVAFADADRFGSVLVRMPAQDSYPYMELYQMHQDKIHQAQYEFIRSGHSCFGYRQKITLSGHGFYAFMYVDKQDAFEGHIRDCRENPEEYEWLSHEERDFHAVRFGYFVLLSNRDGTPEEIFDDYFGKTEIERFLKNSDDCSGLLPPENWNDRAVSGKIMADVMAVIASMELRSALGDADAVSDFIVDSRTLRCRYNAGNGQVHGTHLSEDAREAFERLGISTNYNHSLQWYRERYLLSQPSGI